MSRNLKAVNLSKEPQSVSFSREQRGEQWETARDAGLRQRGIDLHDPSRWITFGCVARNERELRILLTSENFDLPNFEKRNPIAILDLAAWLRARGSVVDSCWLHTALGDVFSAEYDLVGYSILFSLDARQTVRNAAALKEKFGCRVVVGGKWTSHLDGQILALFREHGIEVHRGPGESFFGAAGIDYANYPPWDAKDIESLDFCGPELMTARGCPYSCNFCQKHNREVSFFSVERTVANVKLIKQYRRTGLFFVDDIFFLNHERIREIFRSLRREGIHYEHECKVFCHVNYINDKTIKLMQMIEPYEVQIGIESGNDRMLQLMGKNYTAEKAFQKVKTLAQSGIAVFPLFLLGYPYETEKSLSDTYAFLLKVSPFIRGFWVSYFQPILNSSAYEVAKARSTIEPRSGLNYEINYIDPNLSYDLLKEVGDRFHAFKMENFPPP